MAQKINWSTVIVSAVVAVVVALITVSVMGNVALAPVNQPSVGGSGVINAHKCMADGTCEVNALAAQEVSVAGFVEVNDKFRIIKDDNSYWGLLTAENGNDFAIFNKESSTYPMTIQENDAVKVS